MIDRARFEILPFGKGEQEARELPELVWLTVTASPTHTLDDTVDVATRLRGLGHTVTRAPRRADGAEPTSISTAHWRRSRKRASTTRS